MAKYEDRDGRGHAEICAMTFETLKVRQDGVAPIADIEALPLNLLGPELVAAGTTLAQAERRPQPRMHREWA